MEAIARQPADKRTKIARRSTDCPLLICCFADAPPAVAADRSTALVAVVITSTVAAAVAADAERRSAD